VLYSVLGLRYRSEFATVPGFYAAGDVARGLDQIAVALGHATVAATHIHNGFELPTEAEPGSAGRV